MRKKRSFTKRDRIAYNVLGIGLASGLCVAVGIYIGLKIDAKFGTSPSGSFGGIIFGLISAAVYMFRQIRLNIERFENESNKNEKNTEEK